jgi:hypothetical protein
MLQTSPSEGLLELLAPKGQNLDISPGMYPMTVHSWAWLIPSATGLSVVPTPLNGKPELAVPC